MTSWKTSAKMTLVSGSRAPRLKLEGLGAGKTPSGVRETCLNKGRALSHLQMDSSILLHLTILVMKHKIASLRKKSALL